MKGELAGALLTIRVDSIVVHQLPNGAWLPVQGTIAGGHDGFIGDWSGSSTTIVDVNSITIKREDIPDSLFDLDFTGCTVFNNRIIGIRTGKMAAATAPIVDQMIGQIANDVTEVNRPLVDTKRVEEIEKLPISPNVPESTSNRGNSGSQPIALTETPVGRGLGFGIILLFGSTCLLTFALVVGMWRYRIRRGQRSEGKAGSSHA